MHLQFKSDLLFKMMPCHTVSLTKTNNGRINVKTYMTVKYTCRQTTFPLSVDESEKE